MFDYRMYDPVPCARALQVFKLLAHKKHLTKHSKHNSSVLT